MPEALNPDSEEYRELIHKTLLYAAGLCARSEQCEQDLRSKFHRRQLRECDINSIIEYLRAHNYLNDERYVRAYVRTKSRLSGWGPWKIRNGLLYKGLPPEIITDVLTETDRDLYQTQALKAARIKARRLDLTVMADRVKLYRFLTSRGYESDSINHILDLLTEEQKSQQDDD